jgi:acyl carrier protein
MSELSPTELEVANLIIDSLALEDIFATDIIPNDALFNEGLGLDSIDALELAMAISQKYGFQLKSDDTNNAQIFSSLRNLANHIEAQRKN